MEKLKLVIILCCVTLVVSCIVFVATSCSWNGGQVVSDEALQEAYEKLYLSASSQEELVTSLVDFEVANPAHFKSKLDLAQWYFSLENHVLSWQYLQRALALVNDAGFTLDEKDEISSSDKKNVKDIFLPKGISAFDLELLHRLLAYLCLFRGDVKEAEKYGRISLALTESYLNKVENKDEGLFALSSYLMAQVLFSLAEDEDFTQKETIEKALDFYHKAYKLYPQGLSSIHLSGYGKLLTLVNRYDEAESLLETYLKNGTWSAETATIAKEIYATTKNTYKEKIIEFIYEDYVMGAISLSEENLLDEISSRSWIDEYKNESIKQTEETTFFGENYCQIVLRYQEGRITRGDLDSMMTIEPYFVNFPTYYWLLWNVAKSVLDEGDREVFIPALKKIIALNPTSIYANAARKEIQNLVVTQANGSSSLLDTILF